MPSYQLLIDGALVPGDLTLEVLDPATEEVLAECSRASVEQLDAAVRAAARAFPTWSARPIDQRREVLCAMAAAIEANSDELAALLTAEQGKPSPEARREVGGTAAFFRYAAGLDVPERTIPDDGRDVVVQRRPLGPVAAIIPWNFPLLTVAFKVPFALLAGNTVVVKPAPTTPLTTLRLAEIVASLLPAGVLNVIVDDNDLGDALTAHPDIRKVSFTGSTATGRRVMASAAAPLARLTLELGGNDPALVLPDADPAVVVPAIFDAAFRNAGQVCLAIKRLYVHEDLYDAVCRGLAERAESAVVGPGAEEGTTIGPLQNRRQYDRVCSLIDDARGEYAILAGGSPVERPGYFIRPTVVGDVTDDSELVREEQFGPVLPVLRYTDVDDAVRRCNDSEYGLGASVWSANVTEARRVGERLEAGTVWVNKHADIVPHVPNGGAKSSGFGVEFGIEGLLEFTRPQVLSS